MSVQTEAETMAKYEDMRTRDLTEFFKHTCDEVDDGKTGVKVTWARRAFNKWAGLTLKPDEFEAHLEEAGIEVAGRRKCVQVGNDPRDPTYEHNTDGIPNLSLVMGFAVRSDRVLTGKIDQF